MSLAPLLSLLARPRGVLTTSWRSLLVLLASLALLSRAVGDEPLPAKIRVLFIGNSYTHTFAIPAAIKNLFAPQGVVFEHESVTPGGASLPSHWTDGHALAAIRRGGWDYVVLQDQSARPFNSRQSVIDYVGMFDTEIRKVGARTLVYQTWPPRDTPSNGPYINETYRLAAVAIGGTLVPVGTGWPAAVAAAGSSYSMYISDGSHPSTVGAYFSALTFYRTLTRQTTVGLPPASNISPAQATTMQNVADGVALAATAAPVFNLVTGTYQGAQRVRLNTITPRATIYYTTDSSAPTAASAHVADGGVVAITQSATLKALAIGAGTTSAVTTATYTINSTNGLTLLGNGTVNNLAVGWPATPPNLATTNPGFETGTASPWGFYGAGVFDTTLPRTGTYSGRFTASGGGVTRYVTNLEVNTTYEAFLWGQYGTEVSSAAWSAQMYSNPSVQVSTSVPNLGLPLAWRRFARRFTTDGTKTSAQLGLYQNSGTSAIDDLEVYKVPEGYELGMKFRSSVAGRVTALRVWRPVGGPDAYTLRLWDAAGALLSQTAVSSLSATGWIEAPLATARIIAANTDYVVSYGVAEGGFYQAAPAGLQAAIVNGALSSVAPGNGLQALGRGLFPATSTGANYGADVRFVAATPLQAWRTENFSVADLNNPALEATLWGNFADGDRDGMKTVLEYALERSPTIGELLPPGLKASGVPLSLTFKRARTDVTYIVKASSDLVNWTALATNPGTVGQTITITDTPPANAPRRFLQLEVTSP